LAVVKDEGFGFPIRMLRFRLWGIPVLIDGWFWATAILLGGGAQASGPEDWSRVAVICLVMFFSIMVHEMGHALLGRKYGATPAIKLHGFGGMTFLPGSRFSREQNLWVTAAGPLAGLALWLVLLLISMLAGRLPVLASVALGAGLYINLIWSLFNLLPIQPLDGGQILGELLGPDRAQTTSLIGGVLAVLACAWSLWDGRLFMAFMLALMAYQNFRREPTEGGVIHD
jgi:Zn-dependent protease